MSIPLKLLIVDDHLASGQTRGGVQLLADRLRTGASTEKFTVVQTCTTDSVEEEILQSAAGTVTVFVQRSGFLSNAYGKKAKRWLELGATVVEKNVFARPSAFRPSHKNYHLLLMSRDGAARYRLRSTIFGPFHSPRQYVLQANPQLQDLPARTPVEPSDSVLRFLRVGRPDPIKWSSFEEEFCRKLANTGRDVHLVRVGYPGEPNDIREGSLRITDMAYEPQLHKLYEASGFYIHNSRIGETFGNTVAEALRMKLPVLFANSLYWDTASIELCEDDSIVWGTPDYLLGRSQQVLGALQLARQAATFETCETSVDHFVSTLRTLADGEGDVIFQPMPTLRESLRHVARLRRHSQIRLPAELAVWLVEALRGARGLLRQEM